MADLFRLTYRLVDMPEAFERATLIAETGEAFETTVAPADMATTYAGFLTDLVGGSVS